MMPVEILCGTYEMALEVAIHLSLKENAIHFVI